MNIELEINKDRCSCRFVDDEHDMRFICREGDMVYISKYPEMEQKWFVSFDKYEDDKV